MSAAEIRELGCRRTGTNYLEVVVEDNFDADVVAYQGGWKHGLIEEGARDRFDGHLIVAKNPYSWLVSIEKFYGTNPPQNLWRWIERVHDAEWHFKKSRGVLLESYFMKYAYWFEVLRDRPHHVVRYEDVLDDFEAEMAALGKALKLEPSGDGFRDVDVRVGASRSPEERRLGQPFDPSYYTERRYLEELGDEELSRITTYIKRKGFEPVLDRLGYDLVVRS